MTNEVETPRSYIQWATLAAISAVTKKKIYINKYFYRVYPNIFVMLVGPPGITKSYAIDIAKQMVTSINNTKIISGMNSIEGILEELARNELDERGIPKNGRAEAFVAASEFTVLLLDNTQAFSILTDLYDSCYGDEWKKTLKSGKITLRHPYVTMITATNTAHFNDKLRTVDIEGGFIGRTMLILEKDRWRINSLLRKPERVFNVMEVKSELNRISKLEGEFKFDGEDTIKFFEDWDRDFKNQTKNDHTGIYKRMGDSVLKVSMLMSVSEGNDLILTKDRLEEGIEICSKLITNVKSVTAGVGSAANSAAIVKFIRDLIEAEGHRIEHTDILKKNYGNFDVFELGKIFETLNQAGLVDLEIEGRKRYYVLTDKAIAEYFKNKVGS